MLGHEKNALKNRFSMQDLPDMVQVLKSQLSSGELFNLHQSPENEED